MPSTDVEETVLKRLESFGRMTRTLIIVQKPTELQKGPGGRRVRNVQDDIFPMANQHTR